MAFLAGFVKGFADKAVADADAERKRLAEMDDWQKKQEFMQKLEENAAKRKPVGSRFENGQMVYFNSYGETVFARDATEQERVAAEASTAEARGTIFKNDPKRLEQADADERAKLEFGLLESQARVRASEASAAESGARAGLIGAQREILEKTGRMPGERSTGDLTFGNQKDVIKAKNDIRALLASMREDGKRDPSMNQKRLEIVDQLEAIGEIDSQEKALALIELADALSRETVAGEPETMGQPTNIFARPQGQ